MKKILGLVLVFGFVGFVAFAQTTAAQPSVAFNGDMNTGFYGMAIGSNDPILQSYNDNAPGNGNRWDLQAKYDAGNWGMLIKLRDTGAFYYGDTSDLTFKYAYGWTTFLNKMVTVRAGSVLDTTAKTGSGGGNQGFGSIDPQTGISIDIMPTDGLGLIWFMPYYFASTNASAITPTSAKLSDAFSGSFIGASYYAKGMGDVEVGYQLATKDNNDSVALSGATPYSYFDFGVAYTGMQNLTAYLEGKSTMASTSNTNFTYLGEKIAYAMAPLNLTLWGEQQFGDADVHGTFYNFQPHVDYSLGTATVGAMVDYGSLTVSSTTYTTTAFGPYLVATVGGAKATLGAAYMLGGDKGIAPPILGHVQYGPDMTALAVPLSDNAWMAYALLDWAF